MFELLYIKLESEYMYISRTGLSLHNIATLRLVASCILSSTAKTAIDKLWYNSGRDDGNETKILAYDRL